MNSNRITKYPVKMKPVFKDYIWGGNRLVTEWGKNSPYSVTAESWELAAHKNGQSIALNGPLEGYHLGEVVEAFGEKCLGKHGVYSTRFPILIKLIDSKTKLSIQVHPNDDYALSHEKDFGKTEMWYIADAKQDSFIFCGFKEEITKELFRESIRNHTITDYLNKIRVKKGEVYFITPGTVHAICEGTIIAEIQQNSDITYRLYDYDRAGVDGTKRPLHIEKGLDVARLSKDQYNGEPAGSMKAFEGYEETLLADCQYFKVRKLDIREKMFVAANIDSFQSLLFLEGAGSVCYNNEDILFRRGDSFFIPSGMGSYIIRGHASVLITEI